MASALALEAAVRSGSVDEVVALAAGEATAAPLAAPYAFDLTSDIAGCDHLVSGTVLHLAVLRREVEMVRALMAAGCDVLAPGEVALYHGFDFDGGFYRDEWSPQVLANELGLLHIAEALGGADVRRKKKKRRKAKRGSKSKSKSKAARTGSSAVADEAAPSKDAGRAVNADADADAEKRRSRRRKLRRVKARVASGEEPVAAVSRASDSGSGSDSDPLVTYSHARRATVRSLREAGTLLHAQPSLEWAAEITPDDLVVGESFDSGGYGAIHFGTYAGAAVAVKVMAVPGAAAKAEVTKEIHALALANASPHVCKLYGYALLPDKMCLVMKLYDGCLHDVIDGCPGHRMRTVDIVPAALDIALGLRDLHNMGIVVRDLKPANVLVDAAADTLVLADFGLARVVANAASRELATTRNEACTPNYAAPECFLDGKLTAACDIWSWATTVVHMFTGQPPFVDDSLFQIATKLAVQRVAPPVPERAPDLLRQLLNSCFAFQPADRPTADELVDALEAVIDAGGY
ncbi:TKL protein kinase [Thecamonas trahens ATCC 50062]|uniref:TKL protein kinase n=1 Tax=Thecamonas trahens ATCC 50062 TaxID=461836 RepID=A0A0L0DF41_THETB|nr:TKL protein kinase [Thecamonas trahens ATCC 50062]KNC50962.1 TKL protein kinase [Thecamonas trahens ATCC 50062]|eukprot:XP_013756658.1 TKL protein kinase [Thecamonas trahens ATCC 50062]